MENKEILEEEFNADKLNNEAENAAKKGVFGALNKVKNAAGDAAKWVNDKVPEVIEKAEETFDKTKETAENIVDWTADKAEKAKIWMEAQDNANKLKKMQYELQTLNPIFDNEIPLDYANYPLVNIVDSDEKRSKSEVCKGSYGFMTNAKDLDVLNIYTKNFDKFSIRLDAELAEGVYYVNPYVPGQYIESSRYATYLEQERVRELVNIARDLGARYVKVSFSEVEKEANEMHGKAAIKKGKTKANIEAEMKVKKALKLDIEHEKRYDGHDNPTSPKLVYYKNDNMIKDLIKDRLEGKNKVNSNTYKIAYATSSSKKLKEAIKIDSAVKSLKLSASESLTACAEVESQLCLSYTIVF